MIYEISSDLASFKTLEFKPGLNVLLADKSRGASGRQSRNGAGKTCVVELVHFLLGSRADTSSIFRSHALQEYTFKLAMDLSGERIEVARSGVQSSRILVDGQLSNRGLSSGSSADIPRLQLSTDERYQLSNEEWKNHLGATLFNLPRESGSKLSLPSYRYLLSMFVRRQESGGFQAPTKCFVRQPIADQRIVISYLLGFDWEIAARFKQLRQDEKAAAELRKAMQSGEFGRQFGSVAELRTRLTVEESRNAELRKQLNQYQVVEEYSELEREASQIIAKIGAFNEESIEDRELLEELERSLQSEEIPAKNEISRLYEEVNIVLPELAVRRLHDVEIFHSCIVENRRSHLSAEIEAARKRITERDKHIKSLSRRRAEIMSTLRAGGALEYFTQMQEELVKKEALCQELRNKLETGESLEETRTKLQVERSYLLQDLRNDIHERSEIVKDAVLAFEELSQALYEKEGNLIIDTTENGPKFTVDIAAKRSKGITNVQIFCFDFMLAVPRR